MKNNIIYLLCFIVISVLTSIGYYHFCGRTLMLSEVVGKSSDPKITIVVNLIDFDTGLTRYDLYHLRSRLVYWQGRIRQVEYVQDNSRRQYETEKLLAEMMQDPDMKNIIRKVAAFGAGAS